MAISSNGLAGLKPGVVDSTATRPASPFEGQMIFQKDTDQLLVWNGTAWVIPNQKTQNPEGLELVVSGTQSGTTELSVDGCFTTNYSNYRIVIDRISVSVAGRAIRFNFRKNGVSNQDANYNYAYLGYKNVGTTNNTNAANPTFAEIGVYVDTVADIELGSAVIDVFNPFETKRTRALVNAQGYEGNVYWRQGGFEQWSNNSFDGFRVFLNSTGTVSFTYAVYGYRNS
jgi:hypothetical protein